MMAVAKVGNKVVETLVVAATIPVPAVKTTIPTELDTG
jgi:hypothetical protein